MSTIIDFFKNIVSWVVTLFSSCFDWLVDFVWTFYGALFSLIVSAIPSLQEYVIYLDVIKPYLKFVNTFIAFDVGIFLFTSYLVFVIVFINVKLLIKLIPFIG